MITLKSPGHGIQWSDRGLILNKKALKDIEADITLNESDFA